MAKQNNILPLADESIFDIPNHSQDSDDESKWINPVHEAQPQPIGRTTKLTEFGRRANWENTKPQPIKNPETSGIEISVCYMRTRHEHQYAVVVPYTNLKSLEYKSSKLPPALQQKFQKDIRKGIEVAACVFMENLGRRDERSRSLLFTRIPEWGMDFDRELLYLSVQNTLIQAASNQIKMLCFPSMMMNKEGPLDDQAQIVLQAIIDYIDKNKAERQEESFQSIILRVTERIQFEVYVEAFRAKIQQLCTKK